MQRQNVNISPATEQKLKTAPTVLGSILLAILVLSFFFGPFPPELENAADIDTRTSFELEFKESNVAISWNAKVDSSLTGFQVERAQDNIHYEAIGIVPVREGDYSGEIPSFRLIDRTIEELHFPLVYYRIKEIRKDGHTVYHHPQKIELPFEAKIYASIDAINSESIHFKYASDFPDDIEYQIKDQNDKVIISGNTWSDHETQILEINISKWDSGSYYLKFSHEKNTLIQPFIIP